MYELNESSALHLVLCYIIFVVQKWVIWFPCMLHCFSGFTFEKNVLQNWAVWCVRVIALLFMPLKDLLHCCDRVFNESSALRLFFCYIIFVLQKWVMWFPCMLLHCFSGFIFGKNVLQIWAVCCLCLWLNYFSCH